MNGRLSSIVHSISATAVAVVQREQCGCNFNIYQLQHCGSRARMRALSVITFCVSFVSLFSKDWLLKAANRGFWGFFVVANCSEPSFTKYIVLPVLSCLLWNNAFWFFQNIFMQWWWWKVGPFKLLKGCWVIDSTEKSCSCIQPWALTTVSLNSLMWRHKSVNHLLHTRWRLVESPVMLM